MASPLIAAGVMGVCPLPSSVVEMIRESPRMAHNITLTLFDTPHIRPRGELCC